MTTSIKTRTAVTEKSGVDSVSKLSLGVMGGVSLLVGAWAVVCLVSAMVQTGGPVELIKAWFISVGM